MAAHDNDDDRDYEVGYGKPPKHTRFRKGRSGNPKGRPRGTRGAKALLAETLAQRVMIRENGQESEVSKKEALILSLVNRSIKGDMRAMAQVLRLELEVEGETPSERGGVTINVIDRFDDPE